MADKSFDWLGAPTGASARERAEGERAKRAGGDVGLYEVPGIGAKAGKTRRRAKDPGALRNDPERVMAGAYIRKDVRRRVKQALADPEVGEGTNYSLLVDVLLVRWLEEVGYPVEEG